MAYSYHMLMGKSTLNMFNEIIAQQLKYGVEERYINMRQDYNGQELGIGDKILICTEKEYGWLGYATIIGETPLSWKIEVLDPNAWNKFRNIDKNAKRILKC